MRRLPGLTVALLAALPLLAACADGGDDPDQPRAGPKAQLEAYIAAFARGDGAAACALLTREARAGVPQLSDEIDAPDCEGAVRELARTSERLRSPRISVRVQGDSARATITSRRPRYESGALLRTEDGRWRIAFPPALVRRFESPPGIPADRHGHDRSR